MFAHLFDAIMVASIGGRWPHARSSGPGLTPGRDILFYSWIGRFTLIVPVSTQVFKWIPANLMLGVIL